LENILWQDYGLMVASIGFAIALIPQVYYNWKNKQSPFALQTILTNVFCLVLATVCITTLTLYLTALVNIITIAMWIVLGVQTLSYKKSTKHI
jgi:uncharacterized integral membrane protein